MDIGDLQHIKNLDTIGKLEKLGATGIDVSIEESLFEYGLCWIDCDNDYLFIYPIRYESNDIVPTMFDRASIKKDLNVYEEYDWVKWDKVLSFVGMSKKEWDAMPLPCKISDLISYYGTEEIMGSCYWEGFEIKA